MKHTIGKKKEPQLTIEDVNTGDFFFYKDEVFMKVAISIYNTSHKEEKGIALKLKDNTIYPFLPHEKITPTKTNSILEF